MEDKKVKAGSVAVGICLFIIAILLVVIVLVFYNSTTVKNNLQSEVDELKTSLEEKDKKVEQLEDKISKVSDVIEEDEGKETELDKDSALVKVLYNYVLKYDDSFGSYAWQNGETTSFYRDEKITLSSLSNIEKLLTIRKNAQNTKKITQKDEKDTILKDLKYETKNVEYGDIIQYYEVDKVAQKLFRSEIKSLNLKNCSGCAWDLNLADNTISEINFPGGGMGNTEYAYSRIQKAEKAEDKIYIYDKYIFLDFSRAWAPSDDELVHIYTSADKTKEIGKEKDNFEFDQETGEYDLKDVFEKYEDKLNTYKHTFKKAEDGTYYWVSSEIYE